MSAYPFPIYRHIYTGEASSIKSTHTHKHKHPHYLPAPASSYLFPACLPNALFVAFLPVSLFLNSSLPAFSISLFSQSQSYLFQPAFQMHCLWPSCPYASSFQSSCLLTPLIFSISIHFPTCMPSKLTVCGLLAP